jgi:hypothetical protein
VCGRRSQRGLGSDRPQSADAPFARAGINGGGPARQRLLSAALVRVARSARSGIYAEAVAARARGAYALHAWNALLRHHGFERAIAPPAGSFLRALLARHGGLRGFTECDLRTVREYIARIREQRQLATQLHERQAERDALMQRPTDLQGCGAPAVQCAGSV